MFLLIAEYKPTANSESSIYIVICIFCTFAVVVPLCPSVQFIFKIQVYACSVHPSGPSVENMALVKLFSETVISWLFSLCELLPKRVMISPPACMRHSQGSDLLLWYMYDPGRLCFCAYAWRRNGTDRCTFNRSVSKNWVKASLFFSTKPQIHLIPVLQTPN